MRPASTRFARWPFQLSPPRCRWRWARGLLLAWWLPLPVMAAETTPDLTELALEDLLQVEISTASKFTQSLRHAPSAAQVITSEDIQRHGWRTLAEALNSLHGFFTVNDRAYAFVGTRGFLVPGDYNTRFLLLLNGQRLNDNIYEQANFGDEFPLDLALVERIEYVPGPGSAIYGSNAFFGVINVIARQAGGQTGWQAGTSLSRDGWRELRLTRFQSGSADGPDLLVSVSRASKNGRDLAIPGAAGLIQADGSPSPDGVARGLDSAALTRAYLGWQQGGARLSAWAAQRGVRPSTALYGSNFNDGRLRLDDGSYGLVLAYARPLRQDLELNARLAFQRTTYRADYPYRDETVGDYLNRDDSDGRWWSGELRLLYGGLARHKLLAGLDFQVDQQAVQRNADLAPTGSTPLSVDTRGRRLALYLQDEWLLAPDWRLNLGWRHDRYYYTGRSHSSPRLGLIWSASERTSVKLLAGQAYRVANAYETAYTTGAWLPNPALRPETIRTLEAVVEHRLGPGQELGASLFNYRLEDLIRQVTVGGDQLRYENQAPVSASGLEAFWRLRRQHGVSLSASLALNRARHADGRPLDNSPSWVAKLRGSHPLWNPRWQAALELDAVGPRRLEGGGSPQTLGTQWWLNLSVQATALAPGLQVQLRLLNLFDRRLLQPAAEAPTPLLPLDGRSWQFALSYAF